MILVGKKSFQPARGVEKIGFVDDVVPLKNWPRFVPGHLHGDSSRDPCPHQVPDGSSAEVVVDPVWEAGGLAGGIPVALEITDPASLATPALLGKENPGAFLSLSFCWASTSVHLNNVVRLPCLVEERFRWAVEAQIREPTFARNGLDPILFFSFWGLRAEVDVHRAISVGDRAAVLADARKFLPFCSSERLSAS
jgi:hypothetical protein